VYFKAENCSDNNTENFGFLLKSKKKKTSDDKDQVFQELRGNAKSRRA